MWLFYIPVALFCAYAAYNRFFHPLAKVPGPFLAGITPLWLVWQCMHQRRPRLDIQLHKRYGDIVRITPDEIIFANPEYFKAVYGAGTKFTKSRFYEAPKNVGEKPSWDTLDLLPELDLEKLRVQKRLAGPIYSTSNVKRHESYIDNNIHRSMQRLKTLTSQPLEIFREFELLNVDLMCELTFAVPYGAVEAGSDGAHMASMERMWEWWGWIGYVPWLNALDKMIMPWLVHFSFDNVRLPVFPFSVKKIMEYQQTADEGQTPAPCLLHDLRELTKKRPEFHYNWGTRLGLTDIGAGIDTTSWTLSAVLVGIVTTAPAYKFVRAEIASALEKGTISKDEPVSYEAAMHFEYLQACMHEALRLWPNIAISIPRIAPQGGILINGYYIPVGYTVGMNSRQLGLNEEIFGPNPESFRPERWLEADKSRRNDMETRNLSFGGPSRKCIGMHLAWVSMSKILATLFLNFDIEVLNELDGKPGPGGHVWREKGSFPTKWHGLEINLRRR